MSRFGKPDASVIGAGFTVQGLPPHHKLNFSDLNEADLLETHREYLDIYKTALTAVIEDESQYDKTDNYVHRKDGRTFNDIRDQIEKTRNRVSRQIEVEKLSNIGSVLFPPEDPFNFDPVEEVYRNIRDLCVLEDLNIYLEQFGRHTLLLMDKHNMIEGKMVK